MALTRNLRSYADRPVFNPQSAPGRAEISAAFKAAYPNRDAYNSRMRELAADFPTLPVLLQRMAADLAAIDDPMAEFFTPDASPAEDDDRIDVTPMGGW